MNKLTLFLAFALAATEAFAQSTKNKLVLDDGTEIVSVDDRPGEMDISIFSGKLTDAQRRAYMPENKALSSVNVFLVKTEGKTYMIDAAFGNAVKDKRIDPKTIEAVFITHEHGDHISGLLTEESSANFAASVFISKPESDYWLDMKTQNSDLQKNLHRAYANRYKTFNFGDTLAPGIVAINAVGHTPGHTAFLIGKGKQKLLIAGDFLHAAALQFPEPSESAAYDMNKEAAAKMRRSLMEQAEKNGWFIAGIHIPNPGWGKVRNNGKGGFVHGAE
ncbi:MAG: MBL fold metallo-hydrolase [Fibromonadaceae bacterium]|jgi:glyoxylase-like metal-dependent hydrolase (beta-lactamase superfamily II)|nr:MBL fold metallo-hydrolase [Fibromonadaceae bacterium]